MELSQRITVKEVYYWIVTLWAVLQRLQKEIMNGALGHTDSELGRKVVS
jgi:hypothetical protein